MRHAMGHCQRPWWKRPPVWLLGVVMVGAILSLLVKEIGRPAPMPYGAFLDQLEAGNVASATFHGTEIDGRFKHALNNTPPEGTAQGDRFRSRVPDFGDPALIPELRKQHVAIDVGAASQWASLFTHLPWPLLAFLGLALLAALARIVRGPQAASGSPMPMRPGGPIIGLASILFGRKPGAED